MFAKVSVGNVIEMKPMWLADVQGADRYVGFRGTFTLGERARCRIHLSGASWFVAQLNGEFLAEGPVRFARDSPVYEAVERELEAGSHSITATVHHDGVATRMLEEMAPFLAVEVEDVEVRWVARPLAAWRPEVRRLNPELSWMEWCDTRDYPNEEEGWGEMEMAAARAFAPHGLANIVPRNLPMEEIARGNLQAMFGYAQDDPPVGYFLRALDAAESGADGTWWRFDLGQVRLGRPQIHLEVPVGTVVELGYSESLTGGRVAPWLNQSMGLSCHLDHYVARGGRQTFGPLSPRGMRYVEVHAVGAGTAAMRSAEFLERSYFPAEPVAKFECGDALLEEIWQAGVRTLRACAEDAITDCPTRERGQWLGDVVNVGLATAAVAYPDLRLLRRGLVQAAECARPDGMVASLYPGHRTYLSSYALNWVEACWQYHTITGDRDLLATLLPAAKRNLEVFLAGWDGAVTVALDDCWRFLDWGYTLPAGHGTLPLLLHLHAAVGALLAWQKALEVADEGWQSHYESLAMVLGGVLENREFFASLDYHECTLLLKAKMVAGDRERLCVDKLKAAFTESFPFSPGARPAGLFQFDPATDQYPHISSGKIVTPYFAHFLLPELARRGEMDFVLAAYRRCWGWALEQQSGTWLELFDARSSQCHQWSSCPTWQMSEFLLGLRPARHRHPMGFEITRVSAGLERIAGVLPIAGTNHHIEVSWTEQSAEDCALTIHPSTPIRLFVGENEHDLPASATTWQIAPR